MASASQPLAHYRRRFIRHAFVEDLPEDLQDFGTLVVQMAMRPEFVQQVASNQLRHAGKPVFDRPAYFTWPGMPPKSRQISTEGLRTFHMGFGSTDRVSSASASDIYAAAKAAQEEGIDGPTSQLDAETSQDLGDRGPAIADLYAASHGGLEGDHAMTFTNLSGDLAVRVAQWDSFEREAGAIGLERKASYETGEDRINVRVASGLALVAAVAADASCPDALRALIRDEEQRLAEGRTFNERREKVGAPLACSNASAIHDWIRKTPAWKSASAEERKALKFSAGRTRTTYGNFDMEAPVEFDALAFTNVAKGLVAFISHQPGDPARAIDGAQAPTVVSLHRPDELNNDNNWHFHVNHGRYRSLIEADGTLVTRDGALVIEPVMSPTMTRLDWKMQVRIEAARLINVELERLQVTYRLDPLTDKAIGNEGAPMRKLFKEATVSARAGVPTPLRLENAAEGWRRHFAAIDYTRDNDLKRAEERRDARRNRISAGTPTEAHDDLSTLAERILVVEARGIVARHERLSIEGLVEMRRSAPEEVARYAPEYARKAMRDGKPTYNSAGWQRRAEEASRFLADLDRELQAERQGIAERLEIEQEASRIAARMQRTLIFEMVRATWDDVSADRTLSQIPTLASVPHLGGYHSTSEHFAIVGALATVPTLPKPASPSPHRAIDLIDVHAIRISVEKDRLFVDPLDDAYARVAGIDLTAPHSQDRLRRLKAKQDRELEAIGAYVRRHGKAGLHEDTLAKVTGGLPDMIRKWRDTRTVAGFVTDISQSNTDVASPQKPAALERRAKQPTPISPPAPAPSRSTALEDLHRRNSDAARQRHREIVDSQLARALTNRAGDADEITPLAARLLAKVARGFDPDGMNAPVFATSLDRIDAIEIAILRRNLVFAERLRLAREGDERLLRRVHDIERTIVTPDILGLVPIDGDRIAFGHIHDIAAHGRLIASGRPAPVVRAPSAWIREALPLIEQRSPALTREPDGTIGLYDSEVIKLARGNFVGLLQPDVQARLLALWHVQQQERDEMLRRVANGTLEVNASIDEERGTARTSSSVSVLNAHGLIARVIQRHGRDPGFYFAVHEAVHLQSSHAREADPIGVAARAWLRARDEDAPALTLTVLAERYIGDGRDISSRLATLGRKDARALCATVSAKLLQIVPPEYRPTTADLTRKRKRSRKSAIENDRSADRF